MKLPFHKIGIAHLTCGLIAPTREEYIVVLKSIPVKEMERLFNKAAHLGVGIQLNMSDIKFADSEAYVVLRPYRIEKNAVANFTAEAMHIILLHLI